MQSTQKKLLKLITPRLAAKPKIKPQRDAGLGISRLGQDRIQRLRKGLFNTIKEPFVIRWLDGLFIYIYPNNEISHSLFITGLYELSGFLWLNRVLKPGMTFIDIGANIGLYTLFASRKVRDQGVVIAIEPSSREFHRLNENLALNRMGNVRALKVAISNYTGRSELKIAAEGKEEHNTLGSFGYKSVRLSHKEVVPVESLDTLISKENIDKVDVIKIDIEGAELFALQGAENTLKRFRPELLIELSDVTLERQGCSSTQVCDFLNRLGYKIQLFDPHSGRLVQGKCRGWFEYVIAIATYQSMKEQLGC